MNKQQLSNLVKYLGLKPYCEDGRIQFHGGSLLSEARKAFDELPEIEARMILKLAVRNSDLLDNIQERASIRWEQGYSDSLYDAVMCNIRQVEEFVERDSDGERVRKPVTDWDAELSQYR